MTCLFLYSLYRQFPLFHPLSILFSTLFYIFFAFSWLHSDSEVPNVYIIGRNIVVERQRNTKTTLNNHIIHNVCPYLLWYYCVRQTLSLPSCMCRRYSFLANNSALLCRSGFDPVPFWRPDTSANARHCKIMPPSVTG